MRRGMIVLAVLALFVVTVPMAAGGASHAKATGEVYWTATSGAALYTEFNAHDDAPGAYTDRGVVNMELFGISGWTRTVDVSEVDIVGNEMWLCGEIVAGDNAGLWMTMWVKDDATPGADGDLIGTYKGTMTAACDRVEDHWRGGGVVTGGNLQVH